MRTNIEKFRGIHEGASVAILGSSPTLKLWKGQEDVAIAVNGASICEVVRKRGAKYFMCGDKMSPQRGWFEGSRETCESRLVASFVAPYDYQVIPDAAERARLMERLRDDDYHQSEPGGNIEFTPDFGEIAVSHGVFLYDDLWNQRIHTSQKRFCRGGTVSGVAAQMAAVMGSKDIHLYGCSFGTPGGQDAHYAYDNQGEPGGIDTFHPIRMDYILSELAEEGAKITSHGFTRLRVPGKVDPEVFPQ